MKILVSYRGIPQSPGWETGTFVVSALRQMGHEVIPYGNYYMTNKWLEDRDPQQTLDQSNEYDLYIQMECGDGDRFYQEVVNAGCKKRISWWFDSALYPKRWEHETALISSELNFVANKNLYLQHSEWELKNTGRQWTYYLPYAADKDKHAWPTYFEAGQYHTSKNGIHSSFNKDIDLLIIGSDRPERQAMFKAVSRIVPSVNVVYMTNVFREDYVTALRRSHYVINDIAGGGSGLIPMRPFEVIAAGSHLITPFGDGVKELGIPCFEYRDIDELLLLCQDLMGRERPIRFGFQNTFLENHTYINRCQKILSIL